MSRILLIVFLTICVLGNSGCDLLENAVSNVGGWDLGACIDGYDTCWNLYFDNRDHFDNGFLITLEEL